MLNMIRTILAQGRALFGEMKPHQQMTFVVLALCVMVPFGILIFGSQKNGYQPLQWGALFDRDGLMQAEQALIEAGHEEFETRGQRIYAPAGKVDEYNAVLASTGNVSPGALQDAGSAVESLGPFSTSRQFDLAHDADLRARIQRTLKKIRGIQDAEILWSSSRVGRWGNVKMTRASVFVTPSGGRPLDSTGAETLRAAVSTMLPDLQRENIVVVDRFTNRSWSLNDPSDPGSGDVEQRKQRYIDDYQQRIRTELEQIIPNVVVAVNVEFGNVVGGFERSQQVDPKTVELTTIEENRTRTSSQAPTSASPGTQANQPRSLANAGRSTQENDTEKNTKTYAAPSLTWTEKEIAGLETQSVQVAVSIPEEYFEQIVIREGTSPGTTDQEKANFAKKVDDKKNKETEKIKMFVARLIPSASAADAISVTTHRTIEPEMPTAEVPMTEFVRDLVNQWGSSLALGVFALWALLMLKKSMPASKGPAQADALDKLVQAVRPPEPVAAPEPPRPVTSRDSLQDLVHSDPAAAAAVLAKMIQKA
jgi:flagellar biosynthesis/type III secretory pathway M-ring protein FliF/YscJ